MPSSRANCSKLTQMKTRDIMSFGNQGGLRGLALVTSILFVIAGCSREAAPPEVIRPVKTLIVTSGGEVLTRSFSGRVRAAQEAELTFQVPGYLAIFPVREGQRVVEGDLVAQLRQAEFQAREKTVQAQLDQARVALRILQSGVRPEEQLRLESDVRAAEANLARANAQYERAKSLIKTDAVSRAEYEEAETNFRVAGENLKAAQQRLNQSATGRKEDIEAQEVAIHGLEQQVWEATVQLGDSTLRAPFDGVIAERSVEQNQNVTAGQPIARLQNPYGVDINVDVPESIMASGITADSIVEIVAEFSSAAGQRFPVTVKEIAKVADPITQTFRIRVGMETPKDVRVLPGMTATVTLRYHQGGKLENRILVPFSAVTKDSSGKQVVWVIGGDQVVRGNPVTMGVATDGQVEILQGLQPGTRIAVAGASYLREGMKVRDLGNALGEGLP